MVIFFYFLIAFIFGGIKTALLVLFISFIAKILCLGD